MGAAIRDRIESDGFGCMPLVCSPSPMLIVARYSPPSMLFALAPTACAAFGH